MTPRVFGRVLTGASVIAVCAMLLIARWKAHVSEEGGQLQVRAPGGSWVYLANSNLPPGFAARNLSDTDAYLSVHGARVRLAPNSTISTSADTGEISVTGNVYARSRGRLRIETPSASVTSEPDSEMMVSALPRQTGVRLMQGIASVRGQSVYMGLAQSLGGGGGIGGGGSGLVVAGPGVNVAAIAAVARQFTNTTTSSGGSSSSTTQGLPAQAQAASQQNASP